MNRPARFALAALGAVGATLAWVIVLAWLTGQVVSDRYVWSQWLLWIPTVLVIPIVLIGLLSALRPTRASRRRRRRVLVWTAVTLGVLAWFFTIEHRFLHEPADEGGPRLRLVHWNILDHIYGGIDAHAATLVSLDADVIVLTNPGRAPMHADVRAWMVDTDRHLYWNWPFAIITRFPILRASPILRADDIAAAVAEIDATEAVGRPVIVQMIDLPSSPSRSRVQVTGQTSAMLRNAEFPEADVVAGDFNMTRGSHALRRLLPGMTEAYEAAGHGYGASFRGPLPFALYHIDHILLADTLRAKRYDLIDPGYGWHLMQQVDITAAE